MIYKGEIKIERSLVTFAQLAHANRVILERAKKQESGCYWDFMSSLLFSAFTFEAYINHLGEKSVPFWDDIDRLPRKNKLSVLLKYLGVSPDFGKRPFQTLHSLMLFRDAIAHGKDASITIGPEIQIIDDSKVKYRELAKTKWEELCTLEHAIRAYEDIKSITTELHEVAKLGDPFVSTDSTSYSVRFISEVEEN